MVVRTKSLVKKKWIFVFNGLKVWKSKILFGRFSPSWMSWNLATKQFFSTEAIFSKQISTWPEVSQIFKFLRQTSSENVFCKAFCKTKNQQIFLKILKVFIFYQKFQIKDFHQNIFILNQKNFKNPLFYHRSPESTADNPFYSAFLQAIEKSLLR